MEQQKIHEDTWKKKSHSAFEGKAGGMMPFFRKVRVIELVNIEKIWYNKSYEIHK